jgi:aldose 1-epimerase
MKIVATAFVVAAIYVAAVAGLARRSAEGAEAGQRGLPRNGTEGAEAGRTLYDQACQSCDGPARQGERPPALNTGRFAHANTDDDLTRAIPASLSGTQMPAFARLSDEPIGQIVAYHRSVTTGSVVYAFALDDQDARYAVSRTGDVVTLEDHALQTHVSVLTSVGNIAFDMTVKGQKILRWPFASVDEFKARPTMSGIPFLGPWANRLDEQAFYANGRRYPFDLTLGNIRGGAIPIHGFLTTTTEWRVVDATADAESASVTSRLEFRQPAWIKQWPFPHTIDMTYRLHDGALEVRTAICNESGEPMPVAIGYHPYFQLTDSPRDAWTLGVVFDDLIRDADGRATMTVVGKSQRIDVVLGPNYRATVIWAPKPGEFICIEPMAGITDALNLAHKGIYKDLQSITPSGTWQEAFEIRPSGF